jgi:hypothetical protein
MLLCFCLLFPSFVLQILHVSGLMESVTREQLRELFSQAGEVTKVDIPDGGRSNVSGGLNMRTGQSLFTV